ENGQSSQMLIPFSRTISKLVSLRNAPPPSETTSGSSVLTRALRASVSAVRNTSSPFVSKISAIFDPSRRSISSSRSWKGRPRCKAQLRATVDFPLPINPTRKIERERFAGMRSAHNSNMQSGLLPLFPLQVVLLPGASLPLHIFEDRYKEMIGEVLRAGTEF